MPAPATLTLLAEPVKGTGLPPAPVPVVVGWTVALPVGYGVAMVVAVVLGTNAEEVSVMLDSTADAVEETTVVLPEVAEVAEL